MSSYTGITQIGGLPDLAKLRLSAPLPPKKGASATARIAPLSLEGQPVVVLLGSIDCPVRCPFEATNYSKEPSDRVHLCLEILGGNHLNFSTP